jgi:hypothetical protein
MARERGMVMQPLAQSLSLTLSNSVAGIRTAPSPFSAFFLSSNICMRRERSSLTSRACLELIRYADNLQCILDRGRHGAKRRARTTGLESRVGRKVGHRDVNATDGESRNDFYQCRGKLNNPV